MNVDNYHALASVFAKIPKHLNFDNEPIMDHFYSGKDFLLQEFAE